MNMLVLNPQVQLLRNMGLGWKNSFGTGSGDDTITSGLEGAWTTTPTKWSNNFFENLFGYEWELTKSPAGAHQWKPKDGAGAGTCARCSRSFKKTCTVYAHHRSLLKFRSGL